MTMNFKQQILQMQKYGGVRLMVQYARMGLLGRIAKEVACTLIKHRPLKRVYYVVNDMVAPRLLKKYEDLLDERAHTYFQQEAENGSSCEEKRVIWFCWLQGEEQMPPIVRACFNSLHHHITDRKICFVDGNNWSDYVNVPAELVEKYRKGYMPAAHFSDILRLQLLIRYGGTWIDATVLCAGAFPAAYLDADLFYYQYQGGKGLTNWFLTSRPRHPLLMAVRDGLYAYWHEYDVVVHYFIFHLFLGHLLRRYPLIYKAVPYAEGTHALSLVHHWHLPFHAASWEKAVEWIPFHKLNWKVSKKVAADSQNYYNHILQMMGVS